MRMGIRVGSVCVAASILISGAGMGASASAAPVLNSAVAPGARAVTVGATATVFAILVNSGGETARACRVGLDAGFTGPAPITVSYQTASPANLLTGVSDAPADVPAGGFQNFLVRLTPTAAYTGDGVALAFTCDNGAAPVFDGVNTLVFTAAEAATPDLVPIAVTPSGDGVARIETAGGFGLMAAAAINIGAAGPVDVSADTGRYAWPIALTWCETREDGACLAPPTSSPIRADYGSEQVRTFSVFLAADPSLGTPLLPDLARVFLRFRRPDGTEIGAASVAVTSPDGPRTLRPLDLAAAAAWAEASGARALLIQRDGETLLEQYWGFGRADRAEILNSGTKSFACAAQAVARDQRLFNPDDFAWTGIPYWTPDGPSPDHARKSAIRGRDLLALSHGIPAGIPLGDLSGLDSFTEVLTRTSRFDPDAEALYGRPGFQGFAAMFEGRTGGVWTGTRVSGGADAADAVQTRVLEPIGATVVFDRDLNGKPNFTSGATTTARDWAKYGRLILDDGAWDGVQLMTPSSVRRCMHYATEAYLGYGQSFWLNRAVGDTYTEGVDYVPNEVLAHMPTAGQILPAAPADHYVAWGAGNMQMHLIPSDDLVIVKFGGDGDQNAFFQALFG